MSEDVQPRRAIPVVPRFIIHAAVIAAVFLLTFVPMWLRARTASTNLARTEGQLTLVKMQSSLGAAVIDARRGDYEPARQAASGFFTSLRAEIDKGDASEFTQAQRQSLQPLFDGRDDVITLLARSDPASTDRLSDLFVAYRKIVEVPKSTKSLG